VLVSVKKAPDFIVVFTVYFAKLKAFGFGCIDDRSRFAVLLGENHIHPRITDDLP
jgi:hypothetical protein